MVQNVEGLVEARKEHAIIIIINPCCSVGWCKHSDALL